MFHFCHKKYVIYSNPMKISNLSYNEVVQKRFISMLTFKFSSYPFFKKKKTLFRSLNYIALLAFSFYIIARLNTNFNTLKSNDTHILLRKSFSTFSLSKNKYLSNKRKSFYKKIGISKHLSRLILLTNILLLFYFNSCNFNIKIKASTPLCNIAHSMANLVKHSAICN